MDICLFFGHSALTAGVWGRGCLPACAPPEVCEIRYALAAPRLRSSHKPHRTNDTFSKQDVFEDELSIHLVMELCEGGSVLDGLQQGDYSERQVRVGQGLECVWEHSCMMPLLPRCTGKAPCLVLLSGKTPYLQNPQVQHIMRSVMRFLAQSHSKGIIYRDVKPDNVGAF